MSDCAASGNAENNRQQNSANLSKLASRYGRLLQVECLEKSIIRSVRKIVLSADSTIGLFINLRKSIIIFHTFQMAPTLGITGKN